MDQAERLRLLMQQRVPLAGDTANHVVAVASGKGGVGKTNFCVNFALELQKANRSPIVLDMDVGFANVELLLGERPKHTISDVFDGLEIWDVIQESRCGLPYLSAGSGLTDLHDIPPLQVERLVTELSRLQSKYDTLLLDCGAGHGANAGRLISGADELILVTTPEPTAIADAYALLKMLKFNSQLPTTRLVINRAERIVEAKLAADKLRAVAERFLGIQLGVLGYILEDVSVPKAVMQQQALTVVFPRSKAAGCIQQIARNYLHLQPTPAKAGLAGFFERLLHPRFNNTQKSIS